LIPQVGAHSIGNVRTITFFTVFCLMLPTGSLAQSGPVLVDVAPIERGQIELSRPIVATVEPIIRSTLAAEEAGLVTERLFEEGHRIRKGDVLVKTDTALLRSQVDATAAAVEALRSQIEQASAEQDRAEIEIERMKPVIELKAAPQKEMDDAQRDLRVTTAVLANRSAMLAEKQAEASRLKLMIDKSEVKSPIDGVVARRSVEVGQWIKQGDPVAEIVQLSPLHVRANVPEGLVAQIEEGQSVTVTIDAMPGMKLSGKIDQILPEADPSSRTFAVKILVDNPDLKIRPGFFARAIFLSGSEENSFVVPKDAVLSAGGQSRVMVMRGGASALVPVQILAMSGQSVSVQGEFADGDLAITRGNETLQGGEALQPRNLPQSPPAPSGGGAQPATQPAT